MLDEGVLCARHSLPGKDGDSTTEFPVLMVQANFIKGSFILSFVCHHQTMDMTSQGVIMSPLSKACRGDDFTQEELAADNLSRKDAIPLISGPLKKTDSGQQQIAETQRQRRSKQQWQGSQIWWGQEGPPPSRQPSHGLKRTQQPPPRPPNPTCTSKPPPKPLYLHRRRPLRLRLAQRHLLLSSSTVQSQFQHNLRPLHRCPSLP